MKWIKHDTDANQDAKLQNVMLDYGLEGYGLYWYCIELIAGKVDKDNITFDLEHDARIIAKNTGSTPQKVEEMMRYLVKIGLFENSSGVVTCLKLAKRLDKSMTSNAEMRMLIDNLKNHDPVMTQSGKPMQDKNRIEESRREENRLKKDLSPKVDVNQINDVFNYWSQVMCKGSRTSLTTLRKTKISARLKDGYPVQEIKQAIDNVAKDSFLVAGGHTDIEMICRSDTNLEKYRDALKMTKSDMKMSQRQQSIEQFANEGNYNG